MKRWPLVASFVLFIALCATLAYWAMQFFKPPVRPVAAPPPSVQAPPDINAAASLFGGKGSTAVASNFQLKGIIMAGNPADSVAIIAADGKPAEAVRANTEVLPGVKIKEVKRRYVILLDNGVEKRVELPEENQLAMGGVDGATAAPVAASPLPSRPAPAMPATVVNNNAASNTAAQAPASSAPVGGSGAASSPTQPQSSPATASASAAGSPAAAVPQSTPSSPAAAAPAQPSAPGAGMGSPPITNQGSLAGTVQNPAAQPSPAAPGMPVAVPPARQ